MINNYFSFIKRTFLSVEKKFAKIRLFLPVIFLFGLLADLFYFKVGSDFRLFPLLVLWILVLRIYRFRSDMTFKLALLFLSLLFVSFIVKRESFINERISTWIYVILVLGVVQQFLELRHIKVKNK